MLRRLVTCVAALTMVVSAVWLSSCDKGEEQESAVIVSGDMWANIEKMEGKFCVSLGWEENESGQRQRKGFEDGFKVFGGEVVFANAKYSAKRQSEQIDAFIKTKPRAIFVTPSDPAGIIQACKRVVEAGIPLFVGDATIAGVPATTSICSSDFRMGEWTMDYIAKRLGGKGRIAMVDLPHNEAWDLRGQGAMAALRKYPGIQRVAKFSYDSEGSVTPRQAIDNMLTANPPGKLDAIWCAWDGAAQEGAAAIEAAGRADEIFTTGIDGGKHAFSVIRSGGPFKMTMAQSIYYMSFMDVWYAYRHLKGQQVPRLIISPVYAVDKETLDKLPPDKKAEEYDVPGKAHEFGWTPVL